MPNAERGLAGSLAGSTLKGKRIGLLRQRFVGVTGEREVADTMERVARELRAAGATIVDVAIPDYDEKYQAARGAAPGSLKAAWAAYLTRGAKPGDRVFTIEELIASGKLAPAGQRRLEGALAPIPTGAALDDATRKFYAGREGFRQLLVSAMDAQQLDAMLYPANQARPHTHEGGAERYGTEPGTCEESASTGLPQVTVPAGYLGGPLSCRHLVSRAGCGTTSASWESPTRTSRRRTIAGRRKRSGRAGGWGLGARGCHTATIVRARRLRRTGSVK